MGKVKKQNPHKKSNSDHKQKEKDNAKEAVVSGQLQKKINKRHKKPEKDPRGVVFIKHLPHGFFEEQLKKYFEQFGNVTRVRLARSRRTGNSKGYAFVEFEYPEVAEVAAETMDNYLMFKQIIKASYIPPEKQEFNYFRTSVKQIRNKSGKLLWVSRKTAAIQQKMQKHNNWSEENFQKRTQKQLQKLKKIGEKYAHLGIDINEIVIRPKILTEKEEKLQEKSERNAEEEKVPVSSKTIKRKTLKDNSPSKQNVKKSKSKVSLEDLLGNTLQEDSDDDDYAALSAGEEDGESSDEETYGFSKVSENEDDSENGSDFETSPVLPKQRKDNLKKSMKVSNVERFDQVLKRKPHSGGINKLNKKPLKQPSVTAKKVLQLTAAKEMAKPLSNIKKKLNKPLRGKKSLIKIK